MAFGGFEPAAMRFLAALPDRDPDWFKANKGEYQRLIVEPTKAFVIALGETLAADAPALVAEPKTNGSIAPINNDLRFAPDAPPYKDHLLLRFWEGSPKRTAPTLFVRIAPDSVGFATGIVPADLDRWRSVVDGEDGAELAAAVAELARSQRAEVTGQGLKKVPAPYPADHPRGELLRHKMLQVRWSEPVPVTIAKPGFVDWCARRLRVAMPVHRVLVRAFG